MTIDLSIEIEEGIYDDSLESIEQELLTLIN